MIRENVVVIGAGLTGCLLSILLARRGYQVDVYERNLDVRLSRTKNRKASVNLTLCRRGSFMSMMGRSRTILTEIKERLFTRFAGVR